ncbi:MAG: TonB-dependent receptor [Pseudomonadota bacterium]
MQKLNKNQVSRAALLSVASTLAVSSVPLVASAQVSQFIAETGQIDIPAGPLNLSLTAISNSFNLTVVSSEDIVAGKVAPAIVGSISAEEALERALTNSGLEAKQNSDKTYVISQQTPISQPISANGEQPSSVSDDDDPVRVEREIIVRGTKIANSLQDVDASIEIFTEDRLDREEIVDLSDLLLRVPNVTAGSALGNDFSIRGIGRRGATGAGAGIASNVYVDGAPISPLALLRGPLSLWDVGQTEVLRGPQSSVQGRNALAGAIVISTNDPTYEPEGRLRVTYGRFDELQVAGAFGGPIIQDQVAARIAVDYQDFDGFITDVGSGLQANARESIQVRGKLLIEPNFIPDFSTKFTVDYIDASLGDPAPRIQSDIGLDSVGEDGNFLFPEFDFFGGETFGPFIQNRPETFRLVNETVYDFTDNWLIRGIFTYETTDADRSFGVLDGEPLDPTSFTINMFENDIFSAEVRAEFAYDRFNGFVGAYYYDEDDENLNSNQNILVNLSPLAASANPSDSVALINSTGNSGIENFAAFGQLEWDIDEHWRLNLGFRYDNERIFALNGGTFGIIDPPTCTLDIFGVPDFSCQTAFDLLLGAQVPDAPGQGQEISDRFEAFLPRAAITYNFNNDNSVFLSYQRGYRAGGNEFVLVPTDSLGVNETITNSFDPEFLDTIEVGTRNVFLDGQLIANANVFFSIYTDQQSRIVGPIPEISFFDDFTVNAGESIIYGAEFSLDYTLNDNWNFFASVGLLDTEFTDFEFAAAGPFQNLDGNEFGFAPNVTFTLSANYEHESGFYGNGTFTFTGPQFSDQFNLEEEDFAQAFENLVADEAAAVALNPNAPTPVTTALANANTDAATFGGMFTEEIESRSDLTLRIGYRTDRFNIFAAGTNLLGDDQLRSFNTGSISQQTGELTLVDNVQGLVFLPRSFRIGVEVNF